MICEDGPKPWTNYNVTAKYIFAPSMGVLERGKLERGIIHNWSVNTLMESVKD